MGGQPFLTPPYLVLHREEFAWPRVSPRTPVRSYIKPFRAAPFHPSPRAGGLKNQIARSEIRKSQSKARTAGLFSVALVVVRNNFSCDLVEISNRKICSNAPPLAGSLPCGVRTFLFWLPRFKSEIEISDLKSKIFQQRPPDLLQLQGGAL